jgi:hypothetical protein
VADVELDGFVAVEKLVDLEVDVFVMVEDGGLVEDCVEIVVDGSATTVPMTQYSLVVSRPGQLMPGFSLASSSTEIPQPAAKLSQVSPLAAVTATSQITARRDRARPETIPGSRTEMMGLSSILSLGEMSCTLVVKREEGSAWCSRSWRAKLGCKARSLYSRLPGPCPRLLFPS